MSDTRPTVVVGAGANGLTAATLLARRGRVVVVERAREPGGLCRPLEFHPGYRSCGLLHDPGRLRPWVARAVGLERHGLQRVTHEATVFAAPGETPLVHSADAAVMAAALDSRVDGEAERYRAFRARLAPFRGVLGEFVDREPLDLIRPEANPPVDALRRLLSLRRLGGARMMELLRLPPMSVADLLRESLTDPLLCAGLALPALAGGFAGPRSPGTAFDYLIHDASYEADVAGGAPALAAALVSAAREAGVELLTGRTVTSIDLGDDRSVAGVTLDGGETLDASRVLATCTPRHALLELLAPGALTMADAAHVAELRSRGTTAFLLLALDRQPALAGGASRAVVAAGLDAIERAFDPVKYRELPEDPVLDVRIGGPGSAPADGGTVSVSIHFVPYRGDRERDAVEEERFADRVVELLDAALPGLASAAIGRRLLMPADLESEYGLHRGQLHHGEHALDQRLIRPVPACCRYATPIPGLYLGGSGSHPGGGATCVAGALAAARMG